MGETERTQRLEFVKTEEAKLREEFNKWFYAHRLIEYGAARKEQDYFFWKAGYVARSKTEGTETQ